VDSDLARRQARQAERLSASQPERARQLASAAHRAATENGDQLGVALAERALGLAARELNDLASARRHLRRSIRIADSAGLETEAAESRVRLADVVSLGGSTTAALEQLHALEGNTTGVARVRARAQQALLFRRTGQHEEALARYRLVIPAFRRLGLALDEAQALSNRSVLHMYRGDFAAAEADLHRAEALAPAAGEGFAAAKVHHNLGYVAACRGNVPAALAWFDQAQGEFAALEHSEAPVLVDRAEVLLSVGLATEGLSAATHAVTELEQSGGPALDLAEARLMQARAFLLAGQAGDAARSARKARSAFRRQDRNGWAALADYVIAQVGLLRRLPPIDDLVDTADRLDAAGWVLPALELRLAWATRALEPTGEIHPADREDAVTQLRIVAARRRRGPAHVRAHAWHAEALLRLAAGNRAGGQSALRTGLRVLDEHHAVLGATELRVHAASRAEEMATLGCRLAIEEGRPERVLEWAERWRAGALHLQPMRPPPDKALETMMEELRHTTMVMQQAALDGEPTESLLRRQAALEDAIRDRARHAAGGPFERTGAPPTVATLRSLLEDRALVEYVAIGGRLHAVTIVAGRVRLFQLGAVRQLTSEIDSLRFSYARLAQGRGSEATVRAFAAAADHAANVLDERLFGALRAEIGDRSLVVVPTGRLHHLPWAGLPTCAARTVSVAPSAALWSEAAGNEVSGGRGRVVLVAGPGMGHAEPEIAELATIYPNAVTLVGIDATTQRVANALDGARIAHVAAHGSFRSDNPLFSSLQLADGHLTVFNLERLKASPRLLILSACESGLSDVRPGDELLGLSAAVLSLGTTNLMASVVTVSDRITAILMVEVHRLLKGGQDPPAALAQARQSLHASGEASLLSTAGFVCFGV
jgi:tetratricopeptide (TPR) repeat protein